MSPGSAGYFDHSNGDPGAVVPLFRTSRANIVPQVPVPHKISVPICTSRRKNRVLITPLDSISCGDVRKRGCYSLFFRLIFRHAATVFIKRFLSFYLARGIDPGAALGAGKLPATQSRRMRGLAK